MIILQIILTIVAWFKGWRWKSLIPALILFTTGLLIGVVYGAMGYTVEEVSLKMGWISILDYILIITLIIMCFMSPKNK